MAKKYSVSVEDGEVVSVEVDGKIYTDPEDIPDPLDRDKIKRMIDRTLESDLEEDLDEDLEDELDEDMDEDMDLSTPVGASADPTRIIFFVFLGVALLMLVITGISAYFAVQRMAVEESAQGTVVEMLRRSDSEGNVFSYPVVAFRVPGAGLQTVELSVGSWPPAYEVGELVTVRYDPQKPRQARIESVSGLFDLWLVPLITGFIGLAFLGATYMVHWLGKQT